jgi:hypothetical protein
MLINTSAVWSIVIAITAMYFKVLIDNPALFIIVAILPPRFKYSTSKNLRNKNGSDTRKNKKGIRFVRSGLLRLLEIEYI